MAAIITSYRSVASLGRMPVMTSIWPLSLVSSPSRVCAISKNLGGGHRGLWSVIDWYGRCSWGGTVGTSASAVAHMAVAVGQSLLHATDRDR